MLLEGFATAPGPLLGDWTRLLLVQGCVSYEREHGPRYQFESLACWLTYSRSGEYF